MNASAIDHGELTSRVIRRVIPLVILIYFVSIIDKSNIGFAKLQMAEALGLSEAAFGLGASLFFLGMLLCEIPSSLMAYRFGVRRWVTRIMITWGIATLLLAATKSATMFYVLRFILGISEAGLYPALIFYVSQWFAGADRTRAIGLLTLGSAFGNSIGALASGPLLDLNGTLGLGGWQWLFLVTGALPLIVAIIVWRVLPDRIEDARFLSPEEKLSLRNTVDGDRPAQLEGQSVLRTLVDPRVLGLSLIFITILIALFGMIYWTPTVVAAFGISGTANGVLSALPWLVGVFALITIPPRIRTPRAVLIAMAVIAAVGGSLFLASMLIPHPIWRYLGLVFGTPCISLLITCFWTWPSRYFHGLHAAAAIAAISTYGNLGGFFAQNLMPWTAARMGDPAGALLVPATAMAIIAVGAIALTLGRKAQPVAHALS